MESANIHSYAFDEAAFDMVSLNFVLHHVSDRRNEILAKIFRTLRRNGLLMVWDFAFPERREDLREPAKRFLAVQALIEHLFIGRLLSRTEIETELEAAGLHVVESHLLVDETFCLVVGRKRG